MKYRKILLAYNGSQEGKRALFECADLASFLQAETHLLAVASMPPQVVKTLHDAFKRSLDDPDYLKLLATLDQPAWYQSSQDYAKWAAETFKAERLTIERVGLLSK